MRLIVAAVGRLGRGPEADLIAGFAARIDAGARGCAFGPIQIVEIDDRGRAGAEVAARLLRASEGSYRVVLDERGAPRPSRAFAAELAARRDAGARAAAFLIGGADGHAEETRAAADAVLGFGPMTWPHALARVMLVEQLYRAQTILAGGPYHRD
ncbi:MAG: 23S rRNA (pseudouridine(1915)-N(3))-methyltransferase RlmH [Pseudomonadota bacterium]